MNGYVTDIMDEQGRLHLDSDIRDAGSHRNCVLASTLALLNNLTSRHMSFLCLLEVTSGSRRARCSSLS